MTVILFLLVLAILIFVHELGHFVIARACGIKVTAFALGFGPKLISKTVGETTYSLNLIPFGGYVSIFGEDPNDESVSGPEKDRSFVQKARWQQISVLIAGISFNFIFAFILVSLAFTFGVPASVQSYPEYASVMQNKHIAITFINKGSPADKAGLKAGDTLVAGSMEEVQDNISNSKTNGVDIKYIRNGVEDQVKVFAEKGIITDKYAIGISMDEVGTLKLPFYKSIIESVRFTLHSILATLEGIAVLVLGNDAKAFFSEEFWKTFFNKPSIILNLVSKIIVNLPTHYSGNTLSSVTGPVGIAGLVGDAARLGFSYLIMFTAIISINLGVLNLLPFPALDGGRIFFVIIEAIIRRPIKPAIANTTNAIGFGLLIILMLVVTYRDIVHLFVK